MHIAIIGNGISGTTAARWIRKLSNHEISLISSESDYFYSRTALMYIYMGHMSLKDTQPYEKSFWEKNRITLKKAHVRNIDFDNNTLMFEDGTSMHYDKLILALGSKSNKFGWSGQELEGVRGLYSLQDLQYMNDWSPGIKRALIVGGGLIGVEMAEMFHSRHIPVTMLVRESEYWDNVLPKEEATMISRHICKHGIDLRLDSNLEEIIGNERGKVKAVRVKESGEIIECEYVGLTAGVSPNISFLKESVLDTERGILVDDHLSTNVDDVYAIGDCVQLRTPPKGRRAIEAVWYTGRMMGETVAHNICGAKLRYNPGTWFNSAKFFDIEYQVYGEVPNQFNEELNTFYWEDSDDEKSFRLVFDKNSETVKGFNLLGIRFRHEICEKWIESNASIDHVMSELSLAFFDPEFTQNYIKDIIASYNQRFSRTIKAKSEFSYNRVFKFLKS